MENSQNGSQSAEIEKIQNQNGAGEGNNDNGGNGEGEGSEKTTFTIEEFNAKMAEKDADIAKYRRMAEQRGKKLEEFEKGGKGDKGGKEGKSDEFSFGYGEKAFLKANGFDGDSEYQIILDTMKFTGKPLEDVMNHPYVKAEIQALRQQKQAEDALPKGNNRGGATSRNSVDYWLQKGELPPEDQMELRRKVVNAKIQASKNKQKFGQ